MKVGDKYIIEIEEIIRGYGNAEDDHVHEPIARIKGFNTLVFDQYGLEKLEPYSWEKTYIHGYKDGKNAVINESEKITSKDISDAYDKGLQDAWTFIKDKVLNIEPEERNKIFNSHFCDVILESFSAKEAIDLYKRWEDKQKQDAEIKVGDEVMTENAELGVAVRDTYYLGEDKEPFTLVWFGTHMSSWPVNELGKTGRHFPQIAEVLAELRGEE